MLQQLNAFVQSVVYNMQEGDETVEAEEQIVNHVKTKIYKQDLSESDVQYVQEIIALAVKRKQD